MQLYESVAIRDAWWNICCRRCGAPMADDPYRDIKITWAEILGIGVDLWGKPDGFFVRDFLISLEFRKGQVMVTFCSQGARRGEVQVNVPAGDEEAGELLKAFMDRVRALIEAVESPTTLIDHDDGWPDEEWEDEEEWDEGDE